MIKLPASIRYLLFAIFTFSIITCSGGGDNPIKNDPVELDFNNMVHTPIELTIGSDNYTIPAGGSITIEFETNPGVVDYYATTSGKTASNTVIGLAIEWDFQVDLTGMESDFVDLIIGEAFFFLQYQNNGGVNLTPLYVNYGHSDQTVDNIFLPSDNVNYNTGYYWANTGNEIRTYWDDQSGTYWFSIEGTHYSYPSGNNKLVHITVNVSSKQGITENWRYDKHPETINIEHTVSSKTQTKEILKPVFGKVKN